MIPRSELFVINTTLVLDVPRLYRDIPAHANTFLHADRELKYIQ